VVLDKYEEEEFALIFMSLRRYRMRGIFRIAEMSRSGKSFQRDIR
jgi:hypothetical protein